MKTKILAYGSGSRFNDVVTKYVDLTPISDNVFTCLIEKNEYSEDQDLLGIVVKVKNVFFKTETYSRNFTEREGFAEKNERYAASFIAETKAGATRQDFISSLQIEVFKQLGEDTAPLVAAREAERIRVQQKKAEENRKKLEQQKAREAQQEENHKKQKEEAVRKFINNEMIDSEMFLELCKEHDIKLHIRTIGMIRSREVQISPKTIRFRSKRGQAKPNFLRCGMASRLLHSKLIKAQSED